MCSSDLADVRKKHKMSHFCSLVFFLRYFSPSRKLQHVFIVHQGLSSQTIKENLIPSDVTPLSTFQQRLSEHLFQQPRLTFSPSLALGSARGG